MNGRREKGGKRMLDTREVTTVVNALPILERWMGRQSRKEMGS
jgi:hypothetical protein